MCMFTNFNVKPYRKKKVAYKVVAKDGFRSIFVNTDDFEVGIEYKAQPYNRGCLHDQIGFHAYLKKEDAIRVKDSLDADRVDSMKISPALTVVKIRVRDIQEAGIGSTCYLDIAEKYIAIAARFMTILGEVAIN